MAQGPKSLERTSRDIVYSSLAKDILNTCVSVKLQDVSGENI